MSVNPMNRRRTYSALRQDLVIQTGRLRDCVPIAVRSVYRFFGVNRTFTYKEFIKAGYKMSVGVSDVYSFYKNENLGLILDVHEIKDKADFMKKIKSARENNNPVIIGQPGHAYTIIPHKIVKKTIPVRYDIETGKILEVKTSMVFECFSFYLNKNSEPINLNVRAMRKGSKNLVVCFNSRFKDYEKDIAYSDISNDIKFVEIESVWREFQEGKKNRFYEVEGIKFALGQLKTPKYEFGSTKSEYKKLKAAIRTEAKYWYRKYFKRFKDNCETALDYNERANDSPTNRYLSVEGFMACFSEARDELKLLEKDCFSVYDIGAELRKEFNKNLPALYEKKEIVLYVKH